MRGLQKIRKHPLLSSAAGLLTVCYIFFQASLFSMVPKASDTGKPASHQELKALYAALPSGSNTPDDRLLAQTTQNFVYLPFDQTLFLCAWPYIPEITAGLFSEYPGSNSFRIYTGTSIYLAHRVLRL